MNLKKIITNTLAVVGAIVVIDKVVESVTNMGTKSICDAFNKNFNDCDLDSCCECDCTDSEEYPASSQSEDNISSSTEDTVSHGVNHNDENHSFEYTIKSENITSDPKEI